MTNAEDSSERIGTLAASVRSREETPLNVLSSAMEMSHQPDQQRQSNLPELPQSVLVLATSLIFLSLQYKLRRYVLQRILTEL
jgi:hypothetical protein